MIYAINFLTKSLRNLTRVQVFAYALLNITTHCLNMKTEIYRTAQYIIFQFDIFIFTTGDLKHLFSYKFVKKNKASFFLKI